MGFFLLSFIFRCFTCIITFPIIKIGLKEMTKTTPILLTLAILALFGLSYFASNQANDRQIDRTRNVVLFETKIVEKRHNKIPYNMIEGQFFDIFSNRTFTA